MHCAWPIRPVENLALHEEYVETDIVAYESMSAACQGIDVVVHLAAYPGDGAEFYDTLLRLNMIGSYNAFHAAQAAGCRRVVYASSIDVVMGYAAQADVAWDAPIYPTNVYGASKCWGEALGRVFSTPDTHGGLPADGPLSCICVRIGSPGWDGEATHGSSNFGLSARDCGQLFARAVSVRDVQFAIVAGVSRHAASWMDGEHTSAVLGYEPQDGTAMARL